MAIFPHPGSSKPLKSATGTSRHSMAGCQNLPTAPKTSSRFGCWPRNVQPEPHVRAYERLGTLGSDLPESRAGSPLSHIDRSSSGECTVSRSSSDAAANVVAGSAAITMCSAITD